MPQYAFGSGSLFGVRTDTAVQAPYQFGILQDVSPEFSRNVKELHGGYAFPVAVAGGSGKISFKAKFAQINGRIFSDLFFGGTVTTGQLKTVVQEAGTIPTTPFQITVTNGATWVDDLGVIIASSGIPMVKVASNPTTGQYSVAAGGIYTFAAADTSVGVKISYTYTYAASGVKQVVANPLLGVQPIFMAVLNATWGGKDINFKFHQCMTTKLSMHTKLEDFMIPEFDFSCFADSSGNLVTISTVE
jgi:hypothetical protein